MPATGLVFPVFLNLVPDRANKSESKGKNMMRKNDIKEKIRCSQA